MTTAHIVANIIIATLLSEQGQDVDNVSFAEIHPKEFLLSFVKVVVTYSVQRVIPAPVTDLLVFLMVFLSRHESAYYELA